MSRKKVLLLSDFNCATGLATLAHNIVDLLLQTDNYDFDVIGINHTGEPYDFKKWPFPIYPARDFAKAGKNLWYDDPYGRPRFLNLLSSKDYDIVFTLPDLFIMESIANRIVQIRQTKKFNWIYYYAVDGTLRESWINNSVALADYPIAYTQFAKRETLHINGAVNPQVIYLGINTKDFFPIPDIGSFRRMYFREHADKFIVTNINRNQPRKDIPHTIAAFAKFKQQRPHSLLYLHMNPADVGGNIIEMAEFWGLKQHVDFLVPEKYDDYHGYPIDTLNKLYNASDVLISTTLGEGWGLTVTEAMATKTPVIIPDHTSLSEIGADGRARLVKCGADYTCLGAIDFNRYRPLTDTTDLISALVECHDNRECYRAMAERAYHWVLNLSWDIIGKQWLDIFEAASQKNLC
ncbi:hypothetical protein P22_3393 [Propionispora sp. 2/2-37]|nr:hypothetical protein P22_3393 [Propionispora sp. 2/2-37]